VTHCIGLDHGRTEQYVQETLGKDFDYPGIIQEVAVRSKRYCEAQGVPVKPGLYALLDALDEKGIPYAVATSTKQENARWRLENIGVLDRLQGLVTGDMVRESKPQPEIFLKAAACMGLAPEECAVLEDSPHGILAAHRAGCKPVMIPDLKQPDDETKTLLWAQAETLLDVIPLLKLL
jgi:HAD superfamily hydrolase (TIGR01509 family)